MKFLVVFEDIYNNKYSEVTEQIGTTILELAEEFEVTIDINEEKLNSHDPYDMLTFGFGFFDREAENEEGDYAGRFMIFNIDELEEEEEEEEFDNPYERCGDLEEYEDLEKFAVLDPMGIILDTFATMEEAGKYLDHLLVYHNDAFIAQCSVVILDEF